MNTASIDGEVQWNNDGSVNWEDEISRKDLDDKTIKFLPSTGQYYVYGLKIWKNDVLIKDYVPIKTDNGDGFHENVGNTDIVSQEMIFGSRDTNVFLKNTVNTKIDQKYNDSLGYTETRVNQQAPVDCTGTINDILADVTNITRWDQVTPLWEVSHNATHHYHGRGRYYDCDIDAYLDKDETTQHNIATYRFWHPIQEKYYTITISYDYNDERGNLLSCTYSSSDYATNSSLQTTLSNYTTTTDLDNSINNDVYPVINKSPLYDSEYHWIPQGYYRFIGGSDTIKIYDRYLCDAAGQSIRSANNSFKVGIIKTQTIDPYTSHTSITYDNEVSINIWYERLATRAIIKNYKYFDTTFTLTTADSDISFEVIENGTDLSGHYVICKITGATFGAVTGYSDITVYNGGLDTTDKTIVPYNEASLMYDVTKTRYTVLYNIQQNDFSVQNWTTDAILRGYGLIGNNSGTKINTVTQSEYDQLVADGLVESDQLYIIL